MGSRSRRRERGEAAPPSPSRSERKDAEARASLEPLAPGERPVAVTIAAVLAAIIGVTNLGFLAAGWEVGGDQPSTPGVIIFSGLMVVAAVYMWKGRYWAVLGFQCLLALSCVVSGLSLLVASNVWGALLSVGILVSSGALFWFLVRALARLQMPERPGSVRRHG